MAHKPIATGDICDRLARYASDANGAMILREVAKHYGGVEGQGNRLPAFMSLTGALR